MELWNKFLISGADSDINRQFVDCNVLDAIAEKFIQKKYDKLSKILEEMLAGTDKWIVSDVLRQVSVRGQSKKATILAVSNSSQIYRFQSPNILYVD